MREINDFNEFLDEVINYTDEHAITLKGRYTVRAAYPYKAYNIVYDDPNNKWREKLSPNKLHIYSDIIFRTNIYINIVEPIINNYFKINYKYCHEELKNSSVLVQINYIPYKDYVDIYSDYNIKLNEKYLKLLY